MHSWRLVKELLNPQNESESTMNGVGLLIGGKTLPAQSGRTYQRIDPVKQTAATQAAARAFLTLILPSKPLQVHSLHGPLPAGAPSRALAARRRSASLASSRLCSIHDCRDRRNGRLAGFNVAIGASILREAASMTTQIAGK